MNPRASRCSRALQRPIVSSKDGLWITDSLLAQVFEDYCLVSRAWNRRASHVPGPLESQRRLGRRRMGDLNALYYPPTPPPWEFAIPLDFSKWKWQPPTSSEQEAQPQHQDQQEDHGVGGAGGSLLKVMSMVFTHRIGRRNLYPAAPILSPARVSLQADLDAFRNLDASAPTATKLGHAKVISLNLRTLFVADEARPSEVRGLVMEVLDTLESGFARSECANEVLVTTIRDIVEGISFSRICAPSLLDTSVWHTILDRMSRLSADPCLAELFACVMDIIPQAEHSLVFDGFLSVLGRFFEAWQSSQSRVGVDLMEWSLDAIFGGFTGRDTQALAAALEKLDQETRNQLLIAAEKLAISMATSQVSEDAQKPGICELRYKWLAIVAHSPTLRQDFLFEKVIRFSDPSLELPPLTGSELSWLMIAQWDSRGYLHSLVKAMKHYKNHYKKAPTDANAIASMLVSFDKVFCVHNPLGLMVSFWKLMGLLGRTNDVIASLEVFSDNQKPPKRLLQTLAFAARNHYAALAIREMYTFKIREAGEEEFDPGVFWRYINDILMDPTLPIDTLPRAIGTDFLLLNKPESAHPPMSPDRLWRKRATALERAATALVELDLPHMTDRRIWRQVEHCVNFFSYTRGQVPMKVIEVVYQIVTRDLHEGRPGRTERLAWLEKLVHRSCGPRVAAACRRLFASWRGKLLRLRLAQLAALEGSQSQWDIVEATSELQDLEKEYNGNLDPKVELEMLGGNGQENRLDLQLVVRGLRKTKTWKGPELLHTIEEPHKKPWAYTDEDPEWEGPNIPELFRLTPVGKSEEKKVR
ncbi:hypothetical protein QBC42DRAFT_218667 [Cladorrhinum samala]|uniref:Pentatricopeptide repeat domain-containing protein n=1 Tax=Cladorrhinum samala TaxID=585594 RepID=A0AAV9I2B1_9PEZI|nr:hypothetical protein QBC42DRAFT_218667 [Cladorrhinum samala]